MFKKIITLCSALGLIGLNAPIERVVVEDYNETNQSEVFYHRNMQHSEMLNNYTKVTYKYETNEVQTPADLVVGNIYEFEWPENLSNTRMFMASMVIGYRYEMDIGLELKADTTNHLSVYLTESASTGSVNVMDVNDVFQGSYTVLRSQRLIFVYQSNMNNNFLGYVHPTTYNEIVSVEYIQPTTIIGYINEFLETNLFAEIPYVNQLTFNIGGQDINLMTWLVIIAGLIVSAGLLIGLFLLLKWLFKVFANSFILR